MERGVLRQIPLGTLDRVVEALGATVDVTVRWEGEQLDRLIDAGHAWIVERTVSDLASMGWLTRTEVSFNHYGDRGAVDVLAFHPVARVVLVLEVKTAIGDVQATLGRLDVKARLGQLLAQSAGWTDARVVVRGLVLANSRSARRVLLRHSASFSRYTCRGRTAMAWLRRPETVTPAGLLWSVNVPDTHGMTVTRGRRVRTVNSGP